MATKAVQILTPDQTIRYGNGTAASDTTAGQLLVVSGDDAFDVAAANTTRDCFVAYGDTDSGDKIAALCGGIVLLQTVGGSAAAGDEIMVDAATGFPTKFASGAGAIPLGKIISTSGGYTVRLYY